MSYVDRSITHRKLGSAIGSHECVALVQAWAGAPLTGSWRAGQRVLGNGAHIERGTAIATFVDGHYPDSEQHAAIFLYEDSEGIHVIDQWRGQVSHERVIHAGSHGRMNDPRAYYVIE
jgi:hypothetical protein